jgi:RNA polymerase sigma-70 factor (ECF subfamily)
MAQPALETVLRHLSVLSQGRAARDLTDGELLAGYLARREEAVFGLLVQRHGPLVLGLCRRLLRDRHDAEDVFQATFFVLARKAGSIRRRGSLASWLHGVARRLALRLRSQAACRRGHERRAVPMESVERPDAATWEELRAVLDDEIGALPETLRAPVVLCHLEGKTQTQAAAELGVAQSTVGVRLQRARELLRQRLTRRGLTLTAGALAAALVEQAAPAQVPALLAIAAVRSAGAGAAGLAAAGAVPARVVALAEGVVRAMAMSNLKLFGMTILVGGALGVAGLGWQSHAQAPTGGAGGGVPGANKRPADDLRKAADQLRRLADALERAPDAEQKKLLAEQQKLLATQQKLADQLKAALEQRARDQADRREAALAVIAKGIDDLHMATGKNPHVVAFEDAFHILRSRLKAPAGEGPYAYPDLLRYNTPNLPPAGLPAGPSNYNPYSAPPAGVDFGYPMANVLPKTGRAPKSVADPFAGKRFRATSTISAVKDGHVLFTVPPDAKVLEGQSLDVARIHPEPKLLTRLKVISTEGGRGIGRLENADGVRAGDAVILEFGPAPATPANSPPPLMPPAGVGP